MTSLPDNWPALVLALATALVISYLVADLVARLVQSSLRAVLGDSQVEQLLVERPRRIVRVVIFVITFAALAPSAMSIAGYRTRLGGSPEALLRWLLDAGLRIAIITVAAYFVIRIGTAAAGRFEREMSRGRGTTVIERAKRARTLSQLIQNALSVVTVSIAALMILRELQVDITPVLTGAGIVGLAIGFGAQTLVRDVISGFFLILEDQVRMGDVAAINGQGGLVEQVNLRTLVLRDETGAVHVYPNGEIKTLVNMSKEFSYYVLTVTISFDDDPEPAMAALRDAGASLMDDPAYQPHILEPIEVVGIDDYEPGLMIIKARIKTVALKQWEVGRELRKRIARLFTERGLKWPLPESIMNVRVTGPIAVEPTAPPSRPARP